MNKVTHIFSVALLAAAITATSWAEGDSARFESSGFLKSLDAFIAEQMAKRQGISPGNEAQQLKELELSLRNPQEQNRNLFRLNDSHKSTLSQTGDWSDMPTFSSLLAPTGQLKAAYGFDELVANSRVDVAFGKKRQDDPKKRFELSLKSGLRLSNDSLPVPAAFANAGPADREYNLGVTLGYSGFGVDASLTRQTRVFMPEAIGFDVGFSYQSTSFAARLSLSEYHEGADLYGIENEVRSIVSVELGASYRLTNTIGLNGGVRYYDYGDQWLVDPEAGENSKMIFLGGQLKF